MTDINYHMEIGTKTSPLLEPICSQVLNDCFYKANLKIMGEPPSTVLYHGCLTCKYGAGCVCVMHVRLEGLYFLVPAASWFVLLFWNIPLPFTLCLNAAVLSEVIRLEGSFKQTVESQSQNMYVLGFVSCISLPHRKYASGFLLSIAMC